MPNLIDSWLKISKLEDYEQVTYRLSSNLEILEMKIMNIRPTKQTCYKFVLPKVKQYFKYPRLPLESVIEVRSFVKLLKRIELLN